MIRLSVIQCCSVPDVAENLNAIEKQLELLPEANQQIVLLPECCLFFGSTDQAQLLVAQQHSEMMIDKLSKLANKFKITLVAGSIPLPVENNNKKFTNSSLVFDENGTILGRYDKIHLFDVEVNDNEKQYRESNFVQAGQSLSIVDLPFASIGQTICYDVRFPELYRALRQGGADIICVPAAFTRVTGKAHWQALLQARAIENQVYIIAAGQEGIHANGRETWGHSMIISPWGEILAQIETGQGMISATFEPETLAQVRKSIPVAQHNKFLVEMNL